MADFTITVSNSVRCFGNGPPSLWEAWLWNGFKWGEGTEDIPHRIVHLISESVGSSDATAKIVQHLISESVTPTGMDIFRIFPAYISESIATAGETSSEMVLDGSGYERVFPGGTTDAENRAVTTWASAAADTETWAAASAATTTWSHS